MRRGFCWYEHLSASPDRATWFYREVFGWNTADLDGYRRWVDDGSPVAGVRELPTRARDNGAPAHWLGHLASGSLEDDLAKVAEQGGQSLGPVQEIAGVGRFSLIRDPEGAVVALSSTKHTSVGRLGTRELASASNSDAWEFYEPLLEGERRGTWELGDELGAYLLFEDGLGGRGGISNAARLPGVHCHWAFYFDTPDAPAACARVARAGGRVVHGPFEDPGGDYIAYCEDSLGAAFGIREWGREAR